MKTFRQFLLETPWLNHELGNWKEPMVSRYEHAFGKGEHISTTPSGHKIYKHSTRSGSVAFYATDADDKLHMTLETDERYADPRMHEINYVVAHEGNTIKAHDFYHHLITHDNVHLVSDKEHSPGGAKIWEKLSKMPGIKMTRLGGDNKERRMRMFGGWKRNYALGAPDTSKLNGQEFEDTINKIFADKKSSERFVARRA